MSSTTALHYTTLHYTRLHVSKSLTYILPLDFLLLLLLLVLFSDVCTKYQEASKIVNLALEGIVGQCIPGAKILDLCEFGHTVMEAQASKLYTKKVNGKTIERGVAFPVCISVNDIVCNHSPIPSEERVSFHCRYCTNPYRHILYIHPVQVVNKWATSLPMVCSLRNKPSLCYGGRHAETGAQTVSRQEEHHKRTLV
jgi:hypothetical protein